MFATVQPHPRDLGAWQGAPSKWSRDDSQSNHALTATIPVQRLTTATTSLYQEAQPNRVKASDTVQDPVLALFQAAHAHAPSVAAKSNAGLCRAANQGTA